MYCTAQNASCAKSIGCSLHFIVFKAGMENKLKQQMSVIKINAIHNLLDLWTGLEAMSAMLCVCMCVSDFQSKINRYRCLFFLSQC